MNLRTTFKIDPAPVKINYHTPVMFIGSCFASEIGKQMSDGRLPVLINPSGAVYNPISVSKTIEFIISDKKFTEENLYNNKGEYLSFNHYTDFSSDNKDKCLSRINDITHKAHEFLSNASFLFVTFGTARTYRLRETNEVVSNCHKLPQDNFIQEILSVEDIVTRWRKTLLNLQKFNKNLNVIFTISPVRHIKDGAHGNQVSKSILFVAVEELLKGSDTFHYFPAYELVMDDLRDYRFYADDMLHPSSAAVNYIWEAFSGCFLERKIIDLWNEVAKITKASNHRLTTRSDDKIKIFANRMLKQISEVESKIPSIDLVNERNYFMNLKK